MNLLWFLAWDDYFDFIMNKRNILWNKDAKKAMIRLKNHFQLNVSWSDPCFVGSLLIQNQGYLGW